MFRENTEVLLNAAVIHHSRKVRLGTLDNVSSRVLIEVDVADVTDLAELSKFPGLVSAGSLKKTKLHAMALTKTNIKNQGQPRDATPTSSTNQPVATKTRNLPPTGVAQATAVSMLTKSATTKGTLQCNAPMKWEFRLEFEFEFEFQFYNTHDANGVWSTWAKVKRDKTCDLVFVLYFRCLMWMSGLG
jgi:hypothetical protein